jgi:lipopolysaccharide transport system ATP-binding protein
MKVRLAFAVAAFLEPDILVVDEVLAVGDAEFQKKAIGKMQDISSQGGRTVLFVSHDMAAIQSLCSRLIVLKNGEVSFDGETEEGIFIYSKSRDENYFLSKDRPITDRENTIKLNDLLFLNDNGETIQTVYSGQCLNLLISLESKLKLNNIEIGVGFYDKNDSSMFHCSTKTLNVNKSLIGENSITLKIPKWPLSSAILYLNFYIRSQNDLLIHEKEIIWLKSEQGDFYNTGKLPSWKKGYYIDYEWK